MPIFSNGGNAGFPLVGFVNREKETDSIKNAHDEYDVYVNDEYIGKKVLVTATEEVDDVLDFVKSRGVDEISGSLDGDHYILKTNETEKVKNIVETYLHNR